MKNMDRIQLEDGVNKIIKTIQVIGRTETVYLMEAGGRILAEDICSSFDNPPFNRSPLDGYALIASDTIGASRQNPSCLYVIDEVYAGGFSKKKVDSGQAIRIMTGAPIPDGANCVIRQEDTDYGEDKVAVYKQQAPYDNYCYKGEDFKKDVCIIKAGTKLTYIEIGVAASMGEDKLRVICKPRIALLVTGDELIKPGEELKDGKIYNSNLYLLASRLKELGVEPEFYSFVGDDPNEVANVIRSSIQWADLLISTGGVSVGKKDILHEALELAGSKRIFWGLDLKPGTPTIFSLCEGKPVISLSGNPFGAITNLELLVRPALGAMMKDPDMKTRRVNGIMASDFPKSSKGRRFIRAHYQQGQVTLPNGLHSSGVLASMQGCNCLIDINPNTRCLSCGDVVQVVLL